MNDFQLSDYRNNLSSSVSFQIQQLPEPARKEFLFSYNEEKKDLAIAYIFHFLFGAAYAYQGKWVKQILFWATGFGFGIGWLINILRMPSSIRKVNHKIADKILGNIYRRYTFKQNTRPQDAVDYVSRRARMAENSLQNAKPRNIKPTYDPVHISVENLERGFMVDYQFNTWDVVSEMQIDWEKSGSDRCFKLVHDTHSILINVKRESGQLTVIHYDVISLFSIDSRLEAEINLRNKPSNVIKYKDIPFYRESTKSGLFFNMSAMAQAKKVMVWEYYDDSRQNIIRIEKHGRENIKTLLGKIVSPMEFSDILPKQ
ncbi:DUF4178 domain-containing protein [Chondrinema litorale]|uniref:DUF4178 domain-containing protein n=1 Tax=Chondrinema litorale TaxID=2994555 RepID=UPI002543DD0D|nr:DUF4178 domain-containing protein [Chondrinema litorale]UZR92952.1 DUF4178 domain-containing protein [Chondrinema litorale]